MTKKEKKNTKLADLSATMVKKDHQKLRANDSSGPDDLTP